MCDGARGKAKADTHIKTDCDSAISNDTTTNCCHSYDMFELRRQHVYGLPLLMSGFTRSVDETDDGA